MSSIPGLPGASEPSFQTGVRGWLSLDDVVLETHQWLAKNQVELSPYAVKATVQVTRHLLQRPDAVVGADLPEPDETSRLALFDAVHLELRRRRVLLQRDQVEAVVRAYASVVSILDIRDVSELGL